MPQLVSRSVVACVLSAGVAAVIFHPLPHQLGLIIAALCGVFVGMVVERGNPSPVTTEPEHGMHHQVVQEQPSHDL